MNKFIEKLKKINIFDFENLNKYSEELLKNDKYLLSKLNDIYTFLEEFLDEEIDSLKTNLDLISYLNEKNKNVENEIYKNLLKFLEKNDCKLSPKDKYFFDISKKSVAFENEVHLHYFDEKIETNKAFKNCVSQD